MPASASAIRPGAYKLLDALICVPKSLKKGNNDNKHLSNH